MKRMILVAAVLIMLTGCANMTPQQTDSASARRNVNPFVDVFDPIRISFRALTRNPNKPVVSVDGGYIVIDQEPIYIYQQQDNYISWTVQSPYYFPQQKGIDFVATPASGNKPATPPLSNKCYPDDSQNPTKPAVFTCYYKKVNPVKDAYYRYNITVTQDGVTFISSDPSVVNN